MHGEDRLDGRAPGCAPLPVAAVRGPVAWAAAGQGAVMARRDRAGRRGARAARRRRRWVVLEHVGCPCGDRTRVPRGGLVAADAADHADGAGVVLHPARRLSARAAALPAGARGLRDRCGAERLPASQRRHVRDAADVRGDRSRFELRRGRGRDGGAEDLLRARRGVRLHLPVRVGAGHIRAPLRTAARQAAADARDPGRRRAPDRPPRAHLPAQAAPACWQRPSRVARSSRARASTSCASCCRRSVHGWPSSV